MVIASPAKLQAAAALAEVANGIESVCLFKVGMLISDIFGFFFFAVCVNQDRTECGEMLPKGKWQEHFEPFHTRRALLGVHFLSRESIH